MAQHEFLTEFLELEEIFVSDVNLHKDVSLD